MKPKLTEDEAAFVILQIIQREQHRLQLLLKPFVTELGRLEFRKPACAFALKDGRLVVGRRSAGEIMGRYDAPAWLEEMVGEDHALYEALDRYRENT